MIAPGAERLMPRAAALAARLLLLPGLLLAGCVQPPPSPLYVLTPQAAQRLHPDGVPHLDADGRTVTRYQPQRSFLALALGGVLVDYRQGVARGFKDIFAAGFNGVVADPGQPLPALLRAAEGSRMRLLRAQKDEADHPALLDASDAAVIALPRDPANIDGFAQAAARQQGRPVWALLPAHATAAARLPHPSEAQALAFAALVHGASGVIWQGADNYAARNAGMFGIAPAPQLDYGIATGNDAARLVTPVEAAAAKRLWETAAALNRRLARLAPALLQPDAALPYEIAVAGRDDGARPAMAAPVRTRLKPWRLLGEDGLLLIAVNLDGRSHDLRIDFQTGLRAIGRAAGDEAYGLLEAEPDRGLLRDRIEAHGVRLYRLAP